MNNRFLTLAFLVPLLAPLSALAGEEKSAPIDADLLLRGGTIYDGTLPDPADGKDGLRGGVGDVAIKGDRIIAVGSFPIGKTTQVIDCKGMIVCPGFIDLHNHSDRQVVDSRTRANVNFLMQGCTTVVTGNCGSGPIEVGKYYDAIDAAGAGTNVVHLLPQGALRDAVLGTVDHPPTAEELQKMKDLADQAMRDGAWGMSTGLIYVPSVYAKTDELVEIAKVIAAHGGLYASHIRHEDERLLSAVEEALEIGRRAGLPVQLSHFKASGPKAWGLVHHAAALIEQARKEGLRVTADQYPYTASSTSLEATLIPTWAREGGQKELLARLDHPQHSAEIRKYITSELADRGDRAPIRIAQYTPRPEWIGKSLDEIAHAEKRDIVQVVLEIIRQGGAPIVSFSMNEDDVRFVMQLPWVATASDGRATVPGNDRPHPRHYGTFPRKIGRYALEQKVVPLAQAIYSATGLPAEILGLIDRGYLRPGAYADVVVFDPAQFRDAATFDQPHQYSRGLAYVFVAGQPAVYQGTPTGALAGRALRHTADASDTRESKASKRSPAKP